MQTYFQTRALGANKRARTRSALIDSAIDVFSEKGIEEARISEITAIAGLANGTFYNHFKDKDELAAASAGAIALEIAKQLDDAMTDLDRGVARVVVASSAFMRMAAAHPAWGMVLVQQYHRHPNSDAAAMQYMRADIELAVRQQGLEVIIDGFLLEQTGALIIAALRRLLSDGFRHEVLARTCENILRLLGLTPSQARREVERVPEYALSV